MERRARRDALRPGGAATRPAGGPVHPRADAGHERGLPEPERVHALARGQTASDGLVARWRLRDRACRREPVPRRPPGGRRRRGGRDRQLPAGQPRLVVASDVGRRQLRVARPDRRARVGAGEHRGVRRRRRPRDPCRPVGRRVVRDRPVGSAGRPWSLPARGPSVSAAGRPHPACRGRTPLDRGTGRSRRTALATGRAGSRRCTRSY